MSDTAIEALRLFDHGYHVVPFTRRFNTADSSKPLIIDYIKRRPDMKILVSMYSEMDIAIVPQECVVLELEMRDELDGVSELTKFAVQNGMNWETVTNGCSITKTKSGGFYLWYRQPSERTLVGGISVRPGIEGKAVNEAVHVPPSMGYEALVRINSPKNLPELPGFIADAWQASHSKRGEKRDGIIPLFTIDQRRDRLYSYAKILRKRGGLSDDEIAVLLRHRRDTHGDDLAAISDEEIIKIARDVRDGTGTPVEAAASNKILTAPSALDAARNLKRDVAIVINPSTEESSINSDMPDWCAPTPLFKLFQQWCKDGAVKFQPETNLLIAACTFGCIMGRTYIGPTGFRANLYAMSLLPMGMGHEYPMQCSRHLLEKVGRKESVGRSKIDSDPGMIAELGKAYEVLWFLDDFQNTMKTWGQANCPAHLRNVMNMLLESWAGEMYHGKSSKTLGRTVEIASPHPCLMAFCQPRLFSANCSSELVSSRIFDRFLFTCSDKFTLDTGNGMPKDMCMPSGIVEMINERQIRVNDLLCGKNMAGHISFGIDKDSETAIRNSDLNSQKKAKDLFYKDDLRYALSIRERDKMLRLSMIHAWSLGLGGITEEGYRWARQVVDHSNDCFCALMETSGDSDEISRAINTLLMKISMNPGISKARLISLTRYDKQKFHRAIQALVDSHRVTVGKTRKFTPCYSPYGGERGSK